MTLLDFLRWWLRQLTDCIPRRLRGARQSDQALLLKPLGQSLEISLRRHGTEARVGSFVMDRAGLTAAARSCRGKKLPAVLVLPCGSVLERPLELPIAAERHVDRVVGYEMDRLTPFTRDDVVWSTRIEARSREQGRIAVRLTLVPQTVLHPVIEAIRDLGLRLAAVESDSADGQLRRVTLVRPELVRRENWFFLAAFGLAASLACAAAALPVIRQAVALNAVSREIAGLAPQSAHISMLRKKLSGSASADPLRVGQEHTGDVLQVLADLTDVLPDDTVLDSLSLRAGHLSFAGESASAARLIGMLAADHHFKNPGFAAPVTRAGNRPVDLFSINSDVIPGGRTADWYARGVGGAAAREISLMH